MSKHFRWLLFVFHIFLLQHAALAAIGPVETGTPAFGSFGGEPFDTVNLANLNVHFLVPIIHKAGRGMPFTYDLTYDSSIWYPVTSDGTTSWHAVSNWGWGVQTQPTTGFVSYSVTESPTCYFGGVYKVLHTTTTTGITRIRSGRRTGSWEAQP